MGLSQTKGANQTLTGLNCEEDGNAGGKHAR